MKPNSHRKIKKLLSSVCTSLLSLSILIHASVSQASDIKEENVEKNLPLIRASNSANTDIFRILNLPEEIISLIANLLTDNDKNLNRKNLAGSNKYMFWLITGHKYDTTLYHAVDCLTYREFFEQQEQALALALQDKSYTHQGLEFPLSAEQNRLANENFGSFWIFQQPKLCNPTDEALDLLQYAKVHYLGLDGQDREWTVKQLLNVINHKEIINLMFVNNGLPRDSSVAEALVHNTTLTSLNLCNNNIGDEAAKALARNTTITSLNLFNNYIGDEVAKALAHNITITSLNLSSNNIGNEGAEALARNTTMTSLNLNDNNIDKEGVKPFEHNTKLVSLTLFNNRIGDEGARDLARNTTMTSLNLTGNRIGNEGVKPFKHNSTLTSLVVRSNNIGDEGAEALVRNMTLTLLDLRHNLNIKPETIKTLNETKRPNLQIFF